MHTQIDVRFLQDTRIMSVCITYQTLYESHRFLTFKVPLQPILTDLFCGLDKRLHQKIDLLILNPPYVPTISEEANIAQEHRDIAGSWAGGLTGMEVTNRVLSNVTVRHSDVRGLKAETNCRV